MRTILHSLVSNWKPHLPVFRLVSATVELRSNFVRNVFYGFGENLSSKQCLAVSTVLGLEEGKECVIVGTVYKHMKLKPTILDEYSKERSAIPLVKPHNFMHPDDHLVLEDESGRVKLSGDVLLPSVYVTGIVLALHGKETSVGDFLVLDILEADLPPQIERPLISNCEPKLLYCALGEGLEMDDGYHLINSTKIQMHAGEDKYVIFVSGLSIGSSISNPLQFQLLVDHITGHLGDEKEQGIAAQIVHVVICGNSVEIPRGILNGQESLISVAEEGLFVKVVSNDVSDYRFFVDACMMYFGQHLSAKDQTKLTEPLKELDIQLNQLAAGLPVDIMPGSSDPANFSLPQQVKSLQPRTPTFHSRFLGTSGQNVDDLEKYSEAKDKLEFMERTLRWRHLAPTAPNTLGCYPFTDRDPFLIESCPHVYFIGNQDKFDTRLIKGAEGQMVRLIAIPRFCETGIAVMVICFYFNSPFNIVAAMLNLRNLECHTLSFGTEFS
uniref:DNA polymerase delta small subunit n=1 Tax=Cucumis melo TaxID=3656 RepID=A0A9I9EAC7_CUCME